MMQWQEWVKWVLGLWLFLSPAVLQFGMTGHAWNAYLVATGIAWVAAAALAAFKPWREWIAIALGAWLLISPWLLGFSDAALPTWNAVVVGTLIAVLAAWVLIKERRPRRMA